MSTKLQPADLTEVFTDVLRFREKYKGQYIVIKYGGAIAADESLVAGIGEQAAFLSTAIGAKVIIVHGGGEQASQAIKDSGLEVQFDQATGKRITDKPTLEIFDRTVRALNRHNVEIMNRVSDEVYFQKMAGYDADVVMAVSESDFTGKITSVDARYLTHINGDHIPVFYTACRNVEPRDNESRLNVNADDFAAEVASALGAARLVLLSDVPGILKDGEIMTGLSTQEIQGLIDYGTISGGMVAKANAAKEAAEKLSSGGVVILDGSVKNIILQEILYEKGAGTLIRSEERIRAMENKLQR